MYRYASGTCPKAHHLSNHIITLPLNLWMDNNDVDKIIRIVNDFVQ